MDEAENGGGVRKLSPSPTRSPGPEQRKPSASPPPPRVPKWLILDRIVHRSSRRRCGVVEDDATASALAHDCVGRPIRASLRIADPPAVSRLYLHWKGRPAIDFAEPAAHRNSILFRMRVPFEDPMWWSSIGSFPVDYFVYSSSSSSSSPATLTLLPPCFDGGHTDPNSDKFFQPYRIQQQRIMLDKHMGILCHGDQGGEFTVADLTHRFRTEVHLCLLHHPPIQCQWSIKRLQIPPDMKINISSWRNDVVVPIGRRLCWVDYYQGMLLIDVLSDPDQQQLLQFIPLPSQALKYRRPYKDAGEPDPLRCVCVTDSGIIKLVCILTKEPPSPDPFTITTWILHNVHRGEWRKDVDTIMGATEFFSLTGIAHSCLAHVQPSFPMVSLVDPDVFCFLLEDEDHSLFWMIEVNMRNKKLQSSALYINEEEEEEGYPPKRGRRNNFFGHNFIRSSFTCFLSENAITSWELSEKMQEAKKERVMQKIGRKQN
ncbi:uncharacterized protein LOC8076351 isoform X1 [Sorghum bicolor]|uniref:uncharacterized protein LOC8076351 isoform X1 n=1 Tax=Sorghum bicolor TaxID=4558 RepID=UPI00081AC293|nr:uncharacterized protein LOC8076351 isoform X1 [Sorghum bicolor]|eukprot:XP_021317519.1 uncharacterized protein LOC8076351 isoform X1 [Sorghum bicolor]